MNPATEDVDDQDKVINLPKGRVGTRIDRRLDVSTPMPL
jgi:hypothetical protein